MKGSREWLAENAPADLREDRLPPEPAISFDAIDIDSLDDGSPAPHGNPAILPPTQTLSRGEYLRQQDAITESSSNQTIGNPNRRAWYGGTLPDIAERTDPDLEPFDDWDAVVDGPTEQSPWLDDSQFEYWDDRAAVDELDDRPLWQIEAGLTDEELERDSDDEPDPPAVPLCCHCGQRPIKYTKKGLCSRCNEYARTHQGQLPPPRLIAGRRP